MADKNEEYIAILFSELEKKSQPCSVSEICSSTRGFGDKESKVTDMLMQMCHCKMVTKVNGNKYMLTYKLPDLQDKHALRQSTSLEMDDDSSTKTCSSMSAFDRSTPSSGRAPNSSYNPCNTGAVRAPSYPFKDVTQPLSQAPNSSYNPYNTGAVRAPSYPSKDVTQPLSQAPNSSYNPYNTGAVRALSYPSKDVTQPLSQAPNSSYNPCNTGAVRAPSYPSKDVTLPLSQAPNSSYNPYNTGAVRAPSYPSKDVTQPLSRAPNSSPNQNTGGTRSGNNVDPPTDVLKNLQISHTNPEGQAVSPQLSMVQTTSQSVSTSESESSAVHTQYCQRIINLLKQSSDPVSAKDIAQRTGIGKAASDVNRLLYFLEKRNILCKDDSKKPLWKLKQEPSYEDLVTIGAQLSEIPPSKRSQKRMSSSAGRQSTDGQSSRGDSSGAGQGRPYFQQNVYNIQNTYNTTNNYIKVNVGGQSNPTVFPGNENENGASNQSEPGESSARQCRADNTGDNNSSGQNMADYESRYQEDYEHCQQLGKGGFGVVFKATHKIDKRHYAIKRITLPDREDERNKMMREAQHLAKLESHRGIVRYYHTWIESPPEGWQQQMDKQLGVEEDEEDYDEDYSETSRTPNELSTSDSCSIQFRRSSSDLKSYKTSSSSDGYSTASKRDKKSFLYIQMELCKPETLKEWLDKTSRRERSEVLDKFYQIVSAIEYVHKNDLMHRDLKPSNIFFSMEGVVKIGDFGLVTTIIDEDNVARGKCSRTKHTSRVGTELYMSPELENNRGTYSEKVDIFALGIILYEMLHYFGSQTERCITLTGVKKLQFPEEFMDKMPQEADLLMLLLSQEPEDRPSASEILSCDLLANINDS